MFQQPIRLHKTEGKSRPLKIVRERALQVVLIPQGSIDHIAFKINVMHYGRWRFDLSGESSLSCRNVRAIGNLVGILFVFPPSNHNALTQNQIRYGLL